MSDSQIVDLIVYAVSAVAGAFGTGTLASKIPTASIMRWAGILTNVLAKLAPWVSENRGDDVLEVPENK